jgi:D-serine deaminase-like pyridoxal phosphate-dependent protein
VFHDAGYRDLYPDLPFEPAAVLFSRVISIPAQNRISIDAGSKAISTDPAGDPGTLLNIPGARSLKMSEEHWTFELDDAAGLVPGSPVFILPVHICPTVNLYDAVYTLDGDGKWGPLWRISARGHQLD